MSTLHELQHNWKNYIFDPSLKMMDKIKPEISGESAEERLEIYGAAYEARLLETMEKIFPFLAEYQNQLEDSISFDEVVSEYLKKHPSHYYSIARIGENFSGYLKTDKNNILLSDLAQLEWAISFAVDSADSANGKVLTQADLSEVPQEKWGYLVFDLHPSVQLLIFESNALELYMKKHNAIINTPDQKIYYCRVWRKGLQIYYQSIHESEYFMLKQIRERKTFSQLCESLSDKLPEQEVVQYALARLMSWLTDEILTGATVIDELA